MNFDFGVNVNKLIEGRLYESEEDTLTKEILDDIDAWLEEETEVQNWIEENLR